METSWWQKVKLLLQEKKRKIILAKIALKKLTRDPVLTINSFVPKR